jgi:site-specific DNA-methyltransferase (adenine-specific)
MKPYYKDNAVEIWHGDSLEMLATLDMEAAAIVTDPPYCSGATEAAKRGKRPMMTPESVTARPTIELDAMGSLGFDWVMRRWLLSARRLTKQGGHLACFIDWRMLPPLSTLVEAAGWRWNNTLVWDKGYPGLGTGFRAQHEMVILASNGTPDWHSYDYGNVLKEMRLTDTEHPHQKPVELVQKILLTTTKEGETVLDPFMGSGTTLLAAKQLGRRGIGIDLSEKHCETAAKRCSQEQLALSSANGRSEP